ncbi:MAG: ADP-ribosylglycohydrolase family protein, partial [Chloroflexi bacterium]
APTEFYDYEDIIRKWPPNGPLEPPGKPARITDDTQMALAVGEALLAAPRPFAVDSLAEHIRQKFVAWYHAPDNDRAPGNTCLTSCEKLIDGMAWREACDISSKGCGANMRVQPVGLLNVDATTRAQIAQLQAAITHGHPTALAASDLTAFVIADLGNGGSPDGLPQRAREYALSQRDVYHAEWLGNLWERAYMMPTEREYIAHGWDECLAVLDRLDDALVVMNRQADPCLVTGAGWVAEEAFATALLCFMMFPDDPVAAIHRAAVSSGDSDSIACIAGAFAGVYHGIDAWPDEWIKRIEYHDRIEALSTALHTKEQDAQ